MVCAHCGSESHHTGHSACAKYCTLCNEAGHGQKRAGCGFRVCSKCGASGHSATECNQTECNESCSTTHKSALSFACPKHKCTNCQGTLEPKGHNRSDCPRMQGCNDCGSTTHKSALSFACPEHKCTNCEGTLDKGSQPKRLPSNANYDVRRMRRNRPQREQMPDSSVLCMWSSKSQITNRPFVSRTLYVTGKNCQKVTTTIYAHVQSANRASYSVT
jgi:hypothetical protein